MEIVSREEVLKVVERRGPILPREIVKELGKSDTFMVGAVLSELSSNKKVKITNTKIGASPTYYIEGQEMELQNLSKYLNQKDKRAYDLLEEKKVLRDSKLEPLMRVALRSIKDFSKPLEININSQKEIFWKWYMLSNDEAINLIKAMFKPKEEIKTEETNKVSEVETPKRIFESEIKKIEPEIKEEHKKIIEPREEFSFKKIENFKGSQATLSTSSHENLEKTEFLIQIRNYFKENGIIINEEFLVKKNKEYNFLITLPSVFGRLNYFCKAKDKKRCNELDVGAAYMEADEYRLPTIFLTNGEFTKKAELELKKYKTITIKKI